MILKKMTKFIATFHFILILILISTKVLSETDNFNSWLLGFKKKAVSQGISEKVVNEIMSSAKFLPKVIEYDRYQPEFYEDTFTYIQKRTNKKKVKNGLKLYQKEKNIINKVEKEFLNLLLVELILVS